MVLVLYFSVLKMGQIFLSFFFQISWVLFCLIDSFKKVESCPWFIRSLLLSSSPVIANNVEGNGA